MMSNFFLNSCESDGQTYMARSNRLSKNIFIYFIGSQMSYSACHAHFDKPVDYDFFSNPWPKNVQKHLVILTYSKKYIYSSPDN